MSLLVIGSFRACLVVDTETGNIRPIKRGRCWGIAWNEKNLFVAEWKGKKAAINVFDLNLALIKTVYPPEDMPLTAPHQIYWFDGYLWITNTQYDYIQKWNGNINNPKWEIWRPVGLLQYYNTKGRGNNYVHLNSVWYDYKTKRMSILCHNNKSGSFLQQYSYPFLGLKDQINNVGSGSHNIWREYGRLVVCSSNEGVIKYADSEEVLLHTGGYPRGVVVASDFRVIGISANIPLGRRDRESTDGEIRVYDKEWKNLEMTLPLKGFGQIYDIRMLLDSDRANRTGCDKVQFNL